MTQEDDFILANLVSSYGIGTRSYNRSAEKKELKRQRAAVMERYYREPRKQVVVQMCRCRSFNFPHEISRHEELTSDYDWRTESERRK